MMIIDNFKSRVSKAYRYEPDINPTYQEMAAHYGRRFYPPEYETSVTRSRWRCNW
ncbi:hypothetical protein DFAR_3460044 [Desulfarculales bacterium]